MNLRPIGPILERLRGDTPALTLAKRIGERTISDSTIGRLFKNQDNNVRLHTLEAVANAIGVPLSEVIREAEGGESEPLGFKICPVISDVQAGSFTESFIIPTDQTTWAPMPHNGNGYCFGLYVKGESMISHMGGRSYYPGDIIIVDPTQRTPTDGDLVIVRLDGSDNYTFKKYMTDGTQVSLLPLNTQYSAIHLKEDATIIGTVISRCDPEFAISR